MPIPPGVDKWIADVVGQRLIVDHATMPSSKDPMEPRMTTEETRQWFLYCTGELIGLARQHGMVINVEQKHYMGLIMGATADKITVTEQRVGGKYPSEEFAKIMPPHKCNHCGSVGFSPSKKDGHSCTFCDGTYSGYDG